MQKYTTNPTWQNVLYNPMKECDFSIDLEVTVLLRVFHGMILLQLVDSKTLSDRSHAYLFSGKWKKHIGIVEVYLDLPTHRKTELVKARHWRCDHKWLDHQRDSADTPHHQRRQLYHHLQPYRPQRPDGRCVTVSVALNNSNAVIISFLKSHTLEAFAVAKVHIFFQMKEIFFVILNNNCTFASWKFGVQLLIL